MTPVRVTLRCPTCLRTLIRFAPDRRRGTRCRACRAPMLVRAVTVGALSIDEAWAIQTRAGDAWVDDRIAERVAASRPSLS